MARETSIQSARHIGCASHGASRSEEGRAHNYVDTRNVCISRHMATAAARQAYSILEHSLIIYRLPN